MRLWSLSLTYLDKQGLCGLWRETLLGQACLLSGEYTECPDCSLNKKFNGRLTPELGDTSFRAWVDCPKCKGTGKIKTPYYSHSQLLRFKHSENGLYFIEQYLYTIRQEGVKRGYKFDLSRIKTFKHKKPLNNFLTVTKGQLEYEFKHLQEKLWNRDRKKYFENEDSIKIYCVNETRHRIKSNPIFKVVGLM